MIVQPAGAAVPDPFFAAVRRRHPDVDLVLLPPPDVEELAQVDETTAPPDHERAVEALAANATAVAVAAEQLWSQLADGDEQPTPILAELRHTEPVGAVRAAAEAVTRCDDGDQRLAAAHERLAADGWHVRWPSGGLPRIVATQPGLRATTSYAATTGVLRLVVEGEACAVGRDRAAELVRPEQGRHRS